jgi:hypothetical protein
VEAILASQKVTMRRQRRRRKQDVVYRQIDGRSQVVTYPCFAAEEILAGRKMVWRRMRRAGVLCRYARKLALLASYLYVGSWRVVAALCLPRIASNGTKS